VRDGTRFRPYLASICVSDAEAFTYERECNFASFSLVIYASQGVSYPDGKMQLSQLYVSRRGMRPESEESAARLSQRYLAWGEGVTFAA
jgi:hypothetical protein